MRRRVKYVDPRTGSAHWVPLVAGGVDNPVMDQFQFRWRDDDGNESGATWLELVNADHDLTVSGDTPIRLRFLVKETASKPKSNFKPTLEFRHEGGSWINVGIGTNYVQVRDSVYVVDGGETTQQIGSGTYVSPNQGIDDGDGSAGGNSCDYAGGDEAEFEYSLVIIAADVADNETIDFRIDPADIDNYTVTDATLTIDIPAGADVFFENKNPIEQGMKPNTAAGMGGVLIE